MLHKQYKKLSLPQKAWNASLTTDIPGGAGLGLERSGINSVNIIIVAEPSLSEMLTYT